MNEKPPEPTLRRILLALDATEHSAASLESAAAIAAALNAELAGLFVEDTELLQAAALPLTRTISRHAQAEAALDSALMQRALRIWAAQSRDALAAAAERWQVNWSFHISRGTIAEQVSAEVRSQDLLAFDAADKPARRAQMAARARKVTEQAPCSLLLLHRVEYRSQPVVALYEGSDQVLSLALALAQARHSRFRILAAGEKPATVTEHKRQAAAWLERHRVQADVAGFLLDRSADNIKSHLHSEHAGVLVIAEPSTAMKKPEMQAVLDDLACSILVLR